MPPPTWFGVCDMRKISNGNDTQNGGTRFLISALGLYHGGASCVARNYFFLNAVKKIYRKKFQGGFAIMHKTVVRNQAYRVASFTTVQRHNERENDEYFNGDVELERAKLNVHFCQHFNANGERETYHQTFNRLLAEGKIVKRGTKPDAKLFCELVYDINTSYFDERGGYEFAKEYFAEAYRQAVKEVGSEDYIISAVLHADEKNSRLSEELGRNVYHYHLHVVYVPVVQKEICWSKRTKDKSLVGKVKETIPQISQAKKWPLRQRGEYDGKTVTLNSYSFLQDRYYEHMKAAGFDGFERGERGSTTEHLEVLDYKIQQDRIHAANLENAIAENEKKITLLKKKIKSAEGKALSVKQLEKIPVKISRPLIGSEDTAIISKKDWDNVKKTALIQAKSGEEFHAMRDELATLKNEKSKWQKEKQALENKIAELAKNSQEKFMERATKEAELQTLKNTLAKIPQDVLNAYTRTKSKNHQQEVR
ncbi:MAG: plasmid recombination protein [Defluviitaleaceae bacterium]|nr:plasmid recombination protein [Defluviitaleaceae bacterium]